MHETSSQENRDKGLIPDEVFYEGFLAEDQELMRSGAWDFKNDSLGLNQKKNALELLDENTLNSDQRQLRNDALWLWYHHAAQIEYAAHRDAKTASALIDKALEYGDKAGSKNQITPLLKLLFSGQIEGARVYTEMLPDKKKEMRDDGTEKEIENYEKQTARDLLSNFEQRSG